MSTRSIVSVARRYRRQIDPTPGMIDRFWGIEPDAGALAAVR